MAGITSRPWPNSDSSANDALAFGCARRLVEVCGTGREIRGWRGRVRSGWFRPWTLAPRERCDRFAFRGIYPVTHALISTATDPLHRSSHAASAGVGGVLSCESGESRGGAGGFAEHERKAVGEGGGRSLTGEGSRWSCHSLGASASFKMTANPRESTRTVPGPSKRPATRSLLASFRVGSRFKIRPPAARTQVGNLSATPHPSRSRGPPSPTRGEGTQPQIPS